MICLDKQYSMANKFGPIFTISFESISHKQLLDKHFLKIILYVPSTNKPRSSNRLNKNCVLKKLVYLGTQL